jgi:hypothetical protein
VAVQRGDGDNADGADGGGGGAAAAEDDAVIMVMLMVAASRVRYLEPIIGIVQCKVAARPENVLLVRRLSRGVIASVRR